MCARARLARARSPHSMSPTHFHGASAPAPPPPAPAAPATGSARSRPRPSPPGPPSLSRAPVNQPRGCQSSGGSPRPPAARAAAPAIAAPGPGRGRWPGGSRAGAGLCKQSAISFRGPGLRSERAGFGTGRWEWRRHCPPVSPEHAAPAAPNVLLHT